METYYNPGDLAKFGTIGEKASELAEKFFAYYNAVFEEGALTAREKSLIALAVAHTVQCPYCIDAYTNDCLDKGVSEEQMTCISEIRSFDSASRRMKSTSRSTRELFIGTMIAPRLTTAMYTYTNSARFAVYRPTVSPRRIPMACSVFL